MRIVIVGQGAIGLLWYHHLARTAANRVSLLCSKRIENPPKKYSFTDINNHSTEFSLKLASDTAIAEADLIIVCVKSYQVKDAIKSIQHNLPAKAIVIFCHNGMGALENLASLTQPALVLLTTHGCKVEKPFHVVHTGIGHNNLGLLYGQLTTTIKETMTTTLEQALPSLLFVDNIQEKQWLKLAINCVINPLTALYNIDNGQLLESKYNEIVTELINEIITVASAEGIKFEFDNLQQQLRLVAKNTANNCSSMRADVLQNRKTEIDYINGYIVNLAEKHKICVPANEKLLLKVKALNS